MFEEIIQLADVICEGVELHEDSNGVSSVKLTKEELEICSIAYTVTGNIKYRDAIIKTHLLYSYKYVLNTVWKNFPDYRENVISEAKVAIMDAVLRFNPNINKSFIPLLRFYLKSAVKKTMAHLLTEDSISSFNDYCKLRKYEAHNGVDLSEDTLKEEDCRKMKMSKNRVIRALRVKSKFELKINDYDNYKNNNLSVEKRVIDKLFWENIESEFPSERLFMFAYLLDGEGISKQKVMKTMKLSRKEMEEMLVDKTAVYEKIKEKYMEDFLNG